jgi:hypothetical protein
MRPEFKLQYHKKAESQNLARHDVYPHNPTLGRLRE